MIYYRIIYQKQVEELSRTGGVTMAWAEAENK